MNPIEKAAGEVINETIAVQHVTAYTCVRIIAEAIGSLPLRLYRRLPKGNEEALEHPLHWMLSVEPNSDMGATVF